MKAEDGSNKITRCIGVLVILLIPLGIFGYLIRRHYKRKTMKNLTGLSNKNSICAFNACFQFLFSLEKFREHVIQMQCPNKGIIRTIKRIFVKMRDADGIIDCTGEYNELVRIFSNNNIGVDIFNCAEEVLISIVSFILQEDARNLDLPDYCTTHIRTQDLMEIKQKSKLYELFCFSAHNIKGDPFQIQSAAYIETISNSDIQTTIDLVMSGKSNVCIPDWLDSDFITSFPDYLLLTFNSYGFSLGTVPFSKLMSFKTRDTTYRLKGVILFTKKYLLVPHYYCCAEREGVWYSFDDNYVVPIDIEKFKPSAMVTSAIFEKI